MPPFTMDKMECLKPKINQASKLIAKLTSLSSTAKKNLRRKTNKILPNSMVHLESLNFNLVQSPMNSQSTLTHLFPWLQTTIPSRKSQTSIEMSQDSETWTLVLPWKEEEEAAAEGVEEVVAVVASEEAIIEAVTEITIKEIILEAMECIIVAIRTISEVEETTMEVVTSEEVKFTNNSHSLSIFLLGYLNQQQQLARSKLKKLRKLRQR